MSKEKKNKKGKGCIIAAIIGSIIAAIIVIIVLIGLITIPTYIGASIKIKEAAVKTNMLTAATTIVTHIGEKRPTADQVITEAIINLNNAGTPDDTSDDAYSPFEETLPAYSETAGPGVVTIELSNDNTIEITAYDKYESILDQKIIDIP